MDKVRYQKLLVELKELHKDQFDYTNRPEWAHCKRVCEICFLTLISHGYDLTEVFNSDEYDNVIITSLFHDVMEDVKDGKNKLRNILSPEEYNNNIEKLTLLTKHKGVPYNNYIQRIICSNDWVAILVKFADMLDHVERLPFIEDEKIRNRLKEKYLQPLKWLQQAVEIRTNYLPNTAQYILPPQQHEWDLSIAQAFVDGLGEYAEKGFSDD